MWKDLGDAHAERAGKAIWSLATAPAQSVPFLAKNIRMPAPVDPHQVAQLLHQLDDRHFSVRDRATKKLQELGEPVRRALEEAKKNHPSPETSSRINRVLAALNRHAWSPEQLRVVRAIEVLEHANTAEARQVLYKLAQNTADGRLAGEARQALKRLHQR